MTTGHDIAMGLRAAYWSMHRRTNARLAKHAVTADQFVLLSLLARQDGITQQQLCRRASSDPNTIRAILVLLENGGLIARGQHPTDARARRVTLTRKGRQTYARLSRVLKPLQDRLLGLFRAEQAESLVASLGRISQAMVQLERRRGRPPPPTVRTEPPQNGD